MSSIFSTYSNEVLDIFKKNYQKLILNNIHLTFDEVLNLTREECNVRSSSEEEHLFLAKWFHSINQLGFLEEHFKKPFFELIIHSASHGLRIENDARLTFPIVNLNQDDFQLSLDSLALKQQQKWNYQNPFVSFNFLFNKKDYRVTLIHYSCTSNENSKIFIRSQPDSHPTIELFELNDQETINIHSMIRDKKNFLISGGTGSGKTTFMRSLIPLIDNKEHLIVLEDTYEITNNHPGQTSLLSQKDTLGKTLKDYCAYSLRMSPDRLIVGEMRSSEVVPFILAMNTGHKGLMSTIHANSALDALHRAAMLFTLYSETKDISYELVLKLLCKSIDYVVHIEDKKVKEIIRVIGSEADTPFFEDVSA